ncbi:choice-of-anchor D domain-containing protein, partial [Actinomadura rubrisoli]
PGPSTPGPSPTPGPTENSEGGPPGGPSTPPADYTRTTGPTDRPTERRGTPCPHHAIEPYTFAPVQIGQIKEQDFTFPRRACDNVRAISLRGPDAAGFSPPTLVACPPSGPLCRFRVAFRPVQRGRLYQAVVVVPSTSGGTAVTLRLSGTAAPPVRTCPRHALPVRSLGTAEVGRSVTGVLTVPWDDCYDASGIRLDGDRAFSLTGTRCEGTACRITVTFAPATAGTRSATLVVPSDSGPAAVTLPLSAVAAPSCRRDPPVTAPEFEDAEPGRTSRAVVIVPWGWCFDATRIHLTGDADFHLGPGSTCPAKPGATCGIPVVFEPRTSGPHSTTLTVPDTTGGTAATVPLSAVARTSCKRDAPGPGHRFDDVEVNDRAKEIIGIPWDWCYDPGGISLNGSPSFTLMKGTTCPAETGATCRVRVAFAPATAGPHSATLVVRTREGGPGVSIVITGTATAPCRSPGQYGLSRERGDSPEVRPTQSQSPPCPDDEGEGEGGDEGGEPGGGRVPCKPDPDDCPDGFTTAPEEPPTSEPSGPAPKPSAPDPAPERPEAGPKPSTPDSGAPRSPKPSKTPETEKPEAEKPQAKKPDEPGEPREPVSPHPDEPSTTPSPSPASSARPRAVPTTP